MDESSSSEMLNETYCELPLTVECIESMHLTDVVSDVSSENGTITLILPESTIPHENIFFHTGEQENDKESNINAESREFVADIEHVPKELYTLHYPEKDFSADYDKETNAKALKDLNDSKIQKMLFMDDESLKHQSDLHVIETTTRLEDFMDVVMTYQCKFCRFTCPWKSGLMSHIRNCHVTKNKKSIETEVHNYALAPIADDASVRKSKKVQELEEHGYSQSPHLRDMKNDEFQKEIENENDTPPLERHVFLCGQCTEGFEFLEECKNHMIKEHNLILEPQETRLLSSQKRTSSKMHPLTVAKVSLQKKLISEEGANRSDMVVEVDIVHSQKRTGGRPKSLPEDRCAGNKRKKPKRETSVERPFRCKEKGCGYRFSEESQLKFHSSCHADYFEKNFICPDCGQAAENWRVLSMHLWKEHAMDVDLYTCSECGYKTHSLFKLDNHKKIHSEERQFTCRTCNKGFKQLSQLRNHVVIHTDRKNMLEKRWYSEQKCQVCNRTFSDSKCLKKHQQAVHSKLKPFVCTYCGHMSARKAMLQLHMRQHTGEKPFTCEHCEYRTGDHNSLRRHRMRHTGVKPYKCPHCPYACIQAISFKTHLKNKHPGLDGLYACSLCSFRSVSKENHLNHMSDHKRGAIPEGTRGIVNILSTDLNQPAKIQLPENTLQQLEGILPGNITAAQLIYSCLNALSQESGSMDLPPGVISSSESDGTQTITIQIPTVQEVPTKGKEQFFLTVQQGDDAVLFPTSSKSKETDNEAEILQPITIMQEGTFNDSFVPAAVVCSASLMPNIVKCDA